jgi:glutamate carboxypeptidase
MRKVAAAFALCSSFSAPTFADVSRQETQLVAFLQSHQDESIALLEQIVDINSGTMNFAGVRQVAQTVTPKFAAMGFKTRWIDGAPFHRAGHLIAERPGNGPRIVLIGHLDTVFEPSSPFQKAERVNPSTLKGPGTSDMKGGIVVALAALAALNEAHVLDSLNLMVVLNGDEEDSGDMPLARTALIDAAKNADVALGLENAADDPSTVVTARRSAAHWELRVSGTTAHSSQIFSEEVGAGAIYELSRILTTFYQELKDERYLTINPGLVVGSAQVAYQREPLQGNASGKDNIVAPVAIASGDIRALTVRQRDAALSRMKRIVGANLPKTSASITFDEGYPPMAPTEGNSKLLGMYDEASRDLGFGKVTAVDPGRAGAADISFVAHEVKMAIDGLGLLGGGAHTPNEFADLRTFQIQSQRLAVLLSRLADKRSQDMKDKIATEKELIR